MSSEDLDGILLSAYCSLLTYYFGLLDCLEDLDGILLTVLLANYLLLTYCFGLLDCLEDLDGITADLSQHNLDYGGLLRLVGKQ